MKLKIAIAKHLVLFFICCTPLAGVFAQNNQGVPAPKPLFRDPVYDGAADPTVIWNRSEKKWFMLYTNRRANDTTIHGVAWVHGTRIGIAESEDGANWKYRDTADIGYRPDPGYTFWAPEVIDHQGLYHMYLTYVPGIFTNWNHPRVIIHLTSKNLLNWKYESTLKLVNEKVIDPCVLQLPDGTWRMWYNNETDRKSIFFADSRDLYHWTDGRKAVFDQPGEGPKVFRWKNKYWMITDVWKGLAVYSSNDLENWARQPGGDLLATPGNGNDDGAIGHHCDVIVTPAGRAYIFYFVHPGDGAVAGNTTKYDKQRSSLQVAELKLTDGKLTCNRNEITNIILK
ncbi:family 43 glycosylhydrolase [Mucilaginibacter sp. cycad4]|uniref:family 43 glycosylhydrolase n=1 Tax=Mucilaginibacter sp. cycad4 TaxID=3342096 RepID=UPI0035A16284